MIHCHHMEPDGEDERPDRGPESEPEAPNNKFTVVVGVPIPSLHSKPRLVDRYCLNASSCVLIPVTTSGVQPAAKFTRQVSRFAGPMQQVTFF